MKRMIIKAKSHPHNYETGYLDMTNHIKTTDQYLFNLENCPHGKDGCYVQLSEVEELAEGTS